MAPRPTDPAARLSPAARSELEAFIDRLDADLADALGCTHPDRPWSDAAEEERLARGLSFSEFAAERMTAVAPEALPQPCPEGICCGTGVVYIDGEPIVCACRVPELLAAECPCCGGDPRPASFADEHGGAR